MTTNRTIIHLMCVTIGTIPILLILLLTGWTHEKIGDHSPFIITGFFFIFASLVQFLIVKPTTDRWSKRNKKEGGNLILLGVALSIVAGFNFGLGFGDIMINFLKGTIIFGLFYLTNLFIYSRLTAK